MWCDAHQGATVAAVFLTGGSIIKFYAVSKYRKLLLHYYGDILYYIVYDW